MRTPPRLVLQRLAALLRGQAKEPVLDPGMSCFFILSTGRTGTKTVAELLDAASEATVHHEPHPYLSALSKLAYDTEYNQMGNLIETFMASREVLLRNAAASSLVYGETGPYVTFLAPVIAQALPNAKFIHLVRDPISVVRSGLNRNWYQGSRYDARRIVPRQGDPAARLWKEWSPLEKVVWLWAETNTFVRDFFESLDASRRMCLKAEHIFSREGDSISGMFRFLGLTQPSARAVSGILAQRLNRQRGPMQPLESWLPDWRTRFLELAGDEMSRLGYELPPGGSADA